MQDEFNRLTQKSYTKVWPHHADALAEARASVADALILNPNTPSVELVEILIREAEPELAQALSDTLTRRFYLSAMRSLRRKQVAEQYRLPGFEHLPREIPTRDGTRLALLDANYRRVREYYWSLKRHALDSIPESAKVKEAKALMQKMQKYARDEKGITVRQVLLLENKPITD
jgi:hypothetical protein